MAQRVDGEAEQAKLSKGNLRLVHTHQGGDRADPDTGHQPGRDPGCRRQAQGGDSPNMVGGQRGGDQDQQDGQDAVEGGRPHPGGPCRAESGAVTLPASRFAAMVQCPAKVRQRDRGEPGRQSSGDHDRAEGLVQDNGLQGGEAEQADQQREPELRAAQPDHPAQQPHSGPRGEDHHRRPLATATGPCARSPAFVTQGQ